MPTVPPRVRSLCRIAAAAALAWCVAPGPALGQGRSTEPSLDEIMRRVGQYVAAYGEQAALIVAQEAYTQRAAAEGGRNFQPRKMVAEFAIVKVADPVGWIGFRDVVEVDGRAVGDRRDRLQRLLVDAGGDAGEARRISDESARFNIGPISRNFNVPTTTLFFFRTSNQSRFVFKRKGTKTIDGVETVAIQFVETRRPTMVMTRAGKDVPSEGMMWVAPEDGTVVRTQVRFRGFADQMAFSQRSPGQTETRPAPSSGGQIVSPPPAQAPASTPPPPPSTPPSAPPPPSGQQGGKPTGQATGSSGATYIAPQPTAPLPVGLSPQEALMGADTPRRLESSAEIEVTYRRDSRLGMWLPAKMTEFYEGAISPATGLVRSPVLGQATSVATYSDFKRFETSAKIIIPKQD